MMLIFTAILLSVIIVIVLHTSRADMRELRAAQQRELAQLNAAHRHDLGLRDERIEQLLDQVQLNAQHLPYYPQIGPMEPVEEKRYLSSDDGLIVFEDDAVDEVAGV